MGSDASFESQNLSGAAAAAHIQWIFFNLSYMSVYMRILFNLFNSMRSATTDALTGEEKGEEPLKKERKPNGKQNHVLVHMEHNGERMERSDESDARKRDTPRGVGATRPCVAAADTTGMPERRKGVDVVRPHRRYGNSPSRMAGKERERSEATELYDRIGHETQQGANEASGQPQPCKTGGRSTQKEKK